MRGELMATNQIKIEVNSLKEGMFVSELDRPWSETPFPLQGFFITEDKDIRILADYCKHVFVDMQRKSDRIYENHASIEPSKAKEAIVQVQEGKVLELPPIVVKSPHNYCVSNPMKKEVAKAVKLHKHVYEAIDNVFATIHQGGEISVKETESVAQGMVDSIVRNPDALVWLAKMNEDDAHTYQHSVRASIWALVMGRHLGLDKTMLKNLAMGVLLCHIGKTRIDSELLSDVDQLQGESLAAYQQYVQHSVELLEEMEGIPSAVVSIAKFHQERHNGSGYPQGVTGDSIPLLSKIAGLVDYYQGLIIPRENHLGLSPLDAVAKLYELRNIAFQQDLVEKFIEAIGVYPTGTLVELNSNQVGIVTGHNEDRRLMPKVMVVLDENKQPLRSGKLVDLKEWNLNRKQNELLLIKDSLPKGSYNIDETAYLLSGATSKWSWKHIASLAAS